MSSSKKRAKFSETSFVAVPEEAQAVPVHEVLTLAVLERKLLPAPKFHLWKHAWDRLLVLLILGVLMVFYPGQSVYTAGFGDLLAMKAAQKPKVVLPPPAPFPKNTTGVIPEDEITASGVIVQDLNSSIELWKREESLRLAPASTTKLLTALVALELYQLDDVVTIKTALREGQTIDIYTGEKITVENLLYGALIHSGNDAAYALAEHHKDGVVGFIAAMNMKAKALGMNASNFTNAMGLDDTNHYVTTSDLAKLSRAALENKTIVKMVAIPQITIADVTHTTYHPLKNVNQLLGKIPGVAGLKTGWTEAAGENLVTYVDRNGHRILIVVLRSKDRFGDTEKLINWVFGNYIWEQLKVS